MANHSAHEEQQLKAEGMPEDVLFTGTFRLLLLMYWIAIFVLAALICVTAALATKNIPESDVLRWNWSDGVATVRSVGASFIADSWSILGVFATTLIALAIAGTGEAIQVQAQPAHKATQSGLRRGVFYGFITISVINRIGMACGVFLSIGFVSAFYATAHSAIAGKAAHDVSLDVIRIAGLFGATILAAHVGKFVIPVASRVSELELSRRRIREKIIDLTVILGGQDKERRPPSLLRTAVVAVGAVLSISAPAIAFLAISLAFIHVPGRVKFGLFAISLLTYVAAAILIVFGRIQMDALSVRGGLASRVFVCAFIAFTQFVLMLLGVGGAVAVNFPVIWLMLSGVGMYLVPLLLTVVAYVRWSCLARKFGARGYGDLRRRRWKLYIMAAPLRWATIIPLHDRFKQLERVASQLAELEDASGGNPRRTVADSSCAYQ